MKLLALKEKMYKEMEVHFKDAGFLFYTFDFMLRIIFIVLHPRKYDIMQFRPIVYSHRRQEHTNVYGKAAAGHRMPWPWWWVFGLQWNIWILVFGDMLSNIFMCFKHHFNREAHGYVCDFCYSV